MQALACCTALAKWLYIEEVGGRGYSHNILYEWIYIDTCVAQKIETINYVSRHLAVLLLYNDILHTVLGIETIPRTYEEGLSFVPNAPMHALSHDERPN